MMSRDYGINKSISYGLFYNLYRYLLMSASFRSARRFTQIVFHRSEMIIAVSESRGLFLSIFYQRRKNSGHFITALILSVFICQILIGYLIGRIYYIQAMLSCSLLAVIYFVKEGDSKQIISLYKNSMIFNILNKKI